MSVHFWTKAHAILVTKAARFGLPGIFVAIGATIGAAAVYIFMSKEKDQNLKEAANNEIKKSSKNQ